jgi:K+-transporting ATPase ATPase B chain
LNGDGRSVPKELRGIVEDISKAGGTPLVVAEDRVHSGYPPQDIIKGGMVERFNHMRQMGIRPIMITGDNPLTAATIAREAGVDDFLAQATPEDKMALIKREQEGGKLVAMTAMEQTMHQPGPGRCWRCNEHRDASSQGSRQTWLTLIQTRQS